MKSALSSLVQSSGLAVLLATSLGCSAHVERARVVHTTRDDVRAIFPDVPSGHQYFPAIQFVGSNRIMSALADGQFHPEEGMRRGDYLRTLLDTAGERDIPTPTENPFPDVSADHPLAGYILRAVQLGVIRGYDAGNLQGRFATDRIVSLIEAVKMLLLSFRIPADQLHNLPSYTDVPAGVWFVPFARYVMEHNLIDAQPDGSMGRDRQLNRGQVADLLYRFFQDRPDLLEPFLHSVANQ